MISAIGAVASNGMLGLAGWLPWDIPEELAYFERTVAGAALVIGRLTYESMDVVPEDSFVVSRQQDLLMRPGCTRLDNVEQALSAAVATGKAVFVIGGASLYAAAWPYCNTFYLTRIDQAFDGDTFFPDSIPLDQWRISSQQEKIYRERKTGNDVTCRFIVYEQADPRPLTTAVAPEKRIEPVYGLVCTIFLRFRETRYSLQKLYAPGLRYESCIFILLRQILSS